MTATHYRLTEEGGWFALVHDGRALLVEASAERAAELWPALVEGADALLDRLTAGGLSSAPSFAFTEADAESGLRTILRGPVVAAITAGGSETERSGAGVATWREDADATATAVRVRVGAEASQHAATLPIVSGVVASAELLVDLQAQGVAAPLVAAPVPAAPPAPVPAAPAPVPAAQPFTVPPFAPAAPAPAAPAAQTPVEPAEVDDDVDDDAEPVDAAPVDDAIDERTSVLPPRRPAAAPEQTVLPEQTILPVPEALPAEPVAQPDDDGADEYDYLFGSTVVRSVADAAVRDDEDDDAEGDAEPAAPGALAVPADGDHDGHTVMAADLAELRARRREQGGGAAPAAPAPALHLLRHDGVVESLDQPVLVGRAPSANQVSGGRMPRLVTVSSLGQDISRNHVQFSVEGGTVVVTDLHSRNGTHVVLPGKSPQKLRQGEPTTVIVGTVVDLGGGVTFTVSED